MFRRTLALAGSVLSLAALWASSAQAAVHDFDQQTLAAYLSLRFSSAVPPAVIERVLAAEGFSQRDLGFVAQAAASRQSSSPAETASAAGRGVTASKTRARRVRQISRDRLECPNSDPECELDTEAEPDIAINPTDPGNLLATFQQGRYPSGGSVDPGWSATFDGGRSWPSKGPLPGLTIGVTGGSTGSPGAPFARSSDPVAAFDRKHDRAYVNTLSVSDAGCAVFCESALTLNISKNGGRTFGPPVIAHDDVSDPNGAEFVFNDKNWIATDNHRDSPHYGRTYVSWDQVRCADPSCTVIEQPVLLTYSDDGGKTWHKTIQVTDEQPAQFHQEVGVQPIVLPNGHVVIVYADPAAGVYTFFGNYQAVRSKDGGRHWSEPHLIAEGDPFAEESASLRAPNVPSATASGRRIYVAWHDQRFTSGRNDVVLTRSKNEGRTWSEPINVTPGEADIDHFTPDIDAVGRTVHLTYRAREPGNVNASPMVDAVYRKLRHRGHEPGKPIQLGKPSNADFAAFTKIGGEAPLKFFGDYAGIAASRRIAHPIWEHAHNFKHQTDNPDDTHQRSFSARVG